MNKADRETLAAIIQTQIGVSKKIKRVSISRRCGGNRSQESTDASDANLSAARQPARQKCSQH